MAFNQNEKAYDIAIKLTTKLPELHHIDCEKILFLENDKAKLSYFGKMIKVNELYRYLISYDFATKKETKRNYSRKSVQALQAQQKQHS